ncbi:VOC family protein [Cryptosporangium japonicum]|uniref:VOC domain-containing protein n=1 Tax=Cryptosporangium japonicum TaxID=80872 RepID=A0ABP3EQ94_9ACTN
MSGLTGLWHFSFTVADLDASIRFYRDLLGLVLVHEQRQDNEYTRRLVGYSDADLRVAQLAVPPASSTNSSHDLELVQYLSPSAEPTDPERNRAGAAHLAFTTDDALGTYERLNAAGVEFLSAPNEITAGVNKGGYTCYFFGPDRETLELVQPPSR